MATNFYLKVSIGGGGGGGSVVTSVNGRNGAVTLDKTDVGLSNVDNVSLLAQDLAQKEPTGFENRTDSGISFDDFTRTFFISATGASFSYWVKGINYVVPSGLAIGKQISTTAGNHYIYFDSAGNIQETTTFNVSLFTDNCMIAIVYWNSDNNTHAYFADERHGMQMDGATHGYLHTVFGARYLTGLALQNFVPDGTGNFDVNAVFTSDSGTIRDEDILLTISSQSQLPVLYRQGSLWRKKAADSFPIIYNGTAGYTGTRIPFNEFTSGSWQLTEATDGNYVLIHVFATNDAETPVVAIVGTSQYANAPQARAAVETEISSLSGLPFAEFTAIGSVIYQTNSSYTNVPKARVVSSNPTIGEVYVDFRGEQLYTPSGVATSHSLLSNLSSDDHTQYYNQTRGDARYFQNTGGTITGSITATNLSGTNTGDETSATIKTKLGVASSTSDGYLTSTDWSSFDTRLPYKGSVSYVTAVVANSAPSVFGTAAPSITGTASAVTPTVTSYYTSRKILECTASALSSAIAGWRFTAEYVGRGSSAGVGGFKFSTTFGFQAGFASGGTNRRFYCGFTSATVAPSDVNPSSLGSTQDMFGLGFDNGDANFQIMHATGVATATKVDLGSTFARPTADKNDFYRLEIHLPSNSGNYSYRLTNLITGDVASGTISSGVPAAGVLLSPRCWVSAGGVSSAVGVAFEYIYLQSGE